MVTVIKLTQWLVGNWNIQNCLVRRLGRFNRNLDIHLSGDDVSTETETVRQKDQLVHVKWLQ